MPLLEISNLSVSFRMYQSMLHQGQLSTISDLNANVSAGELVVIAGASGSGKSLLAEAILGILPPNASVTGTMLYRGQPLTPMLQKQLRGCEIAFIPQSASCLDPLMKVGKQADGHKRPRPTAKRRMIFQQLGLPEHTENLYPFQLSGGMARRVLVSTALIAEAELIIADEPTPGMSMEQVGEMFSLFRQMANQGKGVIVITHDIDLAAEFADRIIIFYAGMTIETAFAADFKTGNLRHPYSRALWAALPQNGFQPLLGYQPYAGELPSGCPFAPRCTISKEICTEKIPPIQMVRDGEVRCFYAS